MHFTCNNVVNNHKNTLTLDTITLLHRWKNRALERLKPKIIWLLKDTGVLELELTLLINHCNALL